jgi:hypothetical protein
MKRCAHTAAVRQVPSHQHPQQTTIEPIPNKRVKVPDNHMLFTKVTVHKFPTPPPTEFCTFKKNPTSQNT